MDTEKKTIPGGRVIIFEGIDGTGKTTQIRQAEEALAKDNWHVVTRRIPGGTAIGEELRTTMTRPMPRPPLTDLYISAAIQEALIEEIDKQRAQGCIVLLDRSPMSIAAYQIYGSGIDPALGWHFVEQGMSRIKPELSLIYNCATATALQRARQIANQFDYFESKPESYFERAVEGYKEAATKYSCQIIDASQTIEEVHGLTMSLIAPVLAQV